MAWLKKLGKNDEAMAAIRQLVDLEPGDSESVAELLDWLIDQKAWKVVDRLTERFAPRFAAEPVLLYSLAQACAERGEKKRSEETALRALRLHPGKQDDATGPPLRRGAATPRPRPVRLGAAGVRTRDFPGRRRRRAYGHVADLPVRDAARTGAGSRRRRSAGKARPRSIDAGKVTEAMLSGRERQRRSLAGCTISPPVTGRRRTTWPSSASASTRPWKPIPRTSTC